VHFTELQTILAKSGHDSNDITPPNEVKHPSTDAEHAGSGFSSQCLVQHNKFSTTISTEYQICQDQTSPNSQVADGITRSSSLANPDSLNEQATSSPTYNPSQSNTATTHQSNSILHVSLEEFRSWDQATYDMNISFYSAIHVVAPEESTDYQFDLKMLKRLGINVYCPRDFNGLLSHVLTFINFDCWPIESQTRDRVNNAITELRRESLAELIKLPVDDSCRLDINLLNLPLPHLRLLCSEIIQYVLSTLSRYLPP